MATGEGKADYAKLVAAISHELMSPLSNISGFTRLLQSDSQSVLDERTRDLIHRVRRNTARLIHLLEETGVLLKLHADIETPVTVAFDLNETVAAALKDTAEVIGTGETGPIVEIPAGDLLVNGDPQKTRIGIGGLLLNLAKDLNNRRLKLKVERIENGLRITARHVSLQGEDFGFTQAGNDVSGPSAVVVLELFRALACPVKLFISPEGARQIVVDLPA
ncbi:MAG: histidine kinase dimerization/phospho-acceptor domain-containing protein [Myxococcota bacterium]|jgi:signal transduction histidine kinase